MIAALGDGEDMVYLFHGSQPSFLKAPLTQRMRRSITVTDSLPCSAVLLVRVGTACVFVVLLCGKSLMLFAILTALDSQPWTSACSAPAPWSPRHTNHLLVLASSVSFVSVQARKAHSLHCSSSSHKVVDFAGALMCIRKAPEGSLLRGSSYSILLL